MCLVVAEGTNGVVGEVWVAQAEGCELWETGEEEDFAEGCDLVSGDV